jgi:epoxyqueuosine reductase
MTSTGPPSDAHRAGRPRPARTPAQLRELVRLEIEAAGLDAHGVTGAEGFPDVRATMEERSASGRSGGLTFTYKDPARSTQPVLSFPWARSLVVGAHGYVPAAGATIPQAGRGRVARFAVTDPYRPLRRGLDAVAAGLRQAGHRAEVLVDDDRLVDRAAAVRAGVGWWGRSTMVLIPRLGPWAVLGSVVTDALIAPDPPMVRTCGTCTACLPACPTGALSLDGGLDARRCLAALAQTPGIVPRRLRPAMGDRLYGCDDCLEACPPGRRLADTPVDPRSSVPLRWVLEAADESLMRRFAHFYLPGRTPAVLRRNALVAVGNEGDPGMRDVVAAHLAHPDPILRAHAVWAFARVGEGAVGPVLGHRLEREDDERVLAELREELVAQDPSGRYARSM